MFTLKMTCITLVVSLALTLTSCSMGRRATSAAAEYEPHLSVVALVSRASVETENGLNNFVTTTPSLTSLSTCDLAAARGACSSTSMTQTFSGCTIGASSTTWTGSWTNEYNSAQTCTDHKSAGYLPTSSQIIMKTSAFTVGYTGNAQGVYSTDAHTTWNNVSVGANNAGGISVSKGTIISERYLSFSGIRRILKNNVGNAVGDYSLVSQSQPIRITGSHALQTRAVSGDVTVYDNLTESQMTLTLFNVTWGSTTCCYPTTGRLTASHTAGSNSGLASQFEYTASCGVGTFTDTSGAQQSVILNSCEE